MAKRIIKILLLTLLAVTIYWAANFYRQNLRGALPAFFKPSRDIVQILEEKKPDKKTGKKPAENLTDMPLKLPPGFSISVFAKNLVAPRVIESAPGGTFFVSITSQGQIAAIVDEDYDGVPEKTIIILEGLNKPHGLAFNLGDGSKPPKLYVAESHQVVSYEIDSNLKPTNKKKITDLPGGGGHFTRTLKFGPDGRLLISIGSSCNVCNESDWRRASILAVDTTTEELKIFAKGIRNAVFMEIHPVTKKVWVTEMGRDLLGDDTPPDEINIVEEGKNYGWPNCYGKNIHDTSFDKNTYIRNPCMEPFETPSYIDIPAHSAPLGLAFIPATKEWPEEYWHDLLVAYHGSWNRTEPTGYKIVRMKLDENGNYSGTEDFVTGWFDKGEVLGRPADIKIEGGMIYVSDDKAGAIYKIWYQDN